MEKITWVVCIILLSATVKAQPISLTEYMKPANKLQDVFNVTSAADGTLTIYGYASGANTASSKSVQLVRGEVFAIWKWKWLRPSISVMTVPFKVRRAVGEFPLFSSSGLTNLGLNVAMPEIKLDRYFSRGTKSSQSLSAGLWFAPSVEELTATNTLTPVTAPTKELYFSAAVSIVYTYNNIQLTFIPVGWDTATTTAGKNWAYNGRCWLGFGIGFDPKIFSPSINK